MTSVVDATVVFKLSNLAERHSDKAFALFNDAQLAGDEIAAPTLVWFEVTNAIRKRLRAERLPLEIGLSLLADSLTLPIVTIDPPGLHEEALRLTQRYSLGGQDAHYVALAQLLNCDLWVDDGRLLRAATALPFVRWIGSYAGR